MAIFSQNKNQRKTKALSGRRSPITTYYRNDSPEGESPFKRRAPKRNLRKYLFGAADIILVMAVVFGLIYSLIVRPEPKLIANSQSFHSLEDYRKGAADQLGRVGNRNKITFNEQTIAKNLQKQFPEISDVQIELPLFSQRPTIRLTISAANFYLNSQGKSYIIDSAGRAVAYASSLPSIKGLPVVQDNSGFKTSLGQQVLSAESVTFINNVIAQCQHAGINIGSMSLPAVPQELDLRTTDQSYYVKFYLGGDLLEQAGQFLASRNHFDQTHQPPSQYLDVRVPGKIFYK